ncbi:restriction of telomere capping protein 3 [[Candida] anglica]|uniref:Restriction of telomere capping protein 3 n=1 Tax=[Candida] anglica TaxID=148631 RepID=A0ABP0EBB6_9ASCO
MAAPQKIFYKGTDNDFIIFIEESDSVEKYQKGDTTIPLIDILSIYKVFTNRTGGSEGVLDEASKSELSNEFGTTDIDKVIKTILKDGEKNGAANVQRGGSSTNDSIGAGATGN